jgi:hypothetical protein
MFGTIRKHQSWLWFIIIAVMVLSMVMWQNQLGKSGDQPGGSGSFGSIGGKAITASEFQSAQNETALMYWMRTREWPGNSAASANFDLQQQTYSRLFLIRKLQEFNIHADNDSVAQLAGMMLRQVNNGQSLPMEAFAEQVLKPHRMTAEDFQHFLEHDLGIQQLISVIGTSGKLVTPAESQSLYVQENQEMAADAVFFSASNYLAKIPEPDAQTLGQFYTNQQANYREPEQMQVSYVFFNATNFMPEAEKQLSTNVNRMADEFLTRLGTNGLRYGKTADEARTKIRELIVEEVAISNAYTKAIEFQNEVVTNVPVRGENLSAVAKERGLEVKVTKPFDKEYGPGELNLGGTFPVAAFFNLTPEEPFVDQPIRGTDGVYVLAYNKLIPSRIPSLDEIRTRVVADYKFNQALRLAQMNGHVFAQTATNELAHSKPFAAICTETKVNPVEVRPFSIASETIPEVENHAEVTTFKEVAFSTPVSGVSSFIPTRDGGFVVHVRQRLPIDEAKMKARLPEFANAVRERRQNEAFEMWFNSEASAALRDIPALQSRNRPAAAR